ncbi:MAG TPA: lysyl oxidase family protein [Candidatus Polarisedimenticolia bacterium]|nr:lysyl oxidase family protein [Candidatus Polarisedimenticolia bacterium]
MRPCLSVRHAPRHARSVIPILMILSALLLAPRELEAKKPPPVCTPQVPCTDPRGCPNLVIDPGVLTNVYFDVHTFAPTDCAVVEGMVTAGTRNLILFDTQTNNLGPGELFLGNPLDHPEWFDLTTCHGHAHIKDYADYRLWTPSGYQQWKALRAASPNLCAQQVLDANPALSSQLVRGNKLGLCFFDVVLMGEVSTASMLCPGTPDPRKYLECDFAGLSVCWADIYEPIYGVVDGQWIDVTDVPDGDYVLENESNAKRLITETNYTDNSSAVSIRIHGKKVRVLGIM